MLQAVRIIRTGIATIGLIGAGVGIGVVFGVLILGMVKGSIIGALLGSTLGAILNIFVKKFNIINIKLLFFKAVIIFIVGFIFRYSILYFCHINVFNDIFHPLSVTYYAFMSLFTSFIHIYNIPLVLSSCIQNLVSVFKDEKMAIKLGHDTNDKRQYFNYMDNKSDNSNKSNSGNSNTTSENIPDNDDCSNSNSNNSSSSTSSNSSNPGSSNVGPSNSGSSNPGPSNSGPSDSGVSNPGPSNPSNPSYNENTLPGYIPGSQNPDNYGKNDPYNNPFGLINPIAINTDGRPGTPVCQEDKVGVANYINHITALKEDVEFMEEELKNTSEGIEALTVLIEEKRSLVDATEEERNALGEAEIDPDDPNALLDAIIEKGELNSALRRRKDDITYMSNKLVEKNLSLPVQDNNSSSQTNNNSNDIEKKNQESSKDKTNAMIAKYLEERDNDDNNNYNNKNKNNNKRSHSSEDCNKDYDPKGKRPRRDS